MPCGQVASPKNMGARQSTYEVSKLIIQHYYYGSAGKTMANAAREVQTTAAEFAGGSDELQGA